MGSIFHQHDIGIYFLIFLSLNQMKNYILLCKSSLNIFQKSIYYSELSSYKLKLPNMNIEIYKICEYGYIYLLKAMMKDNELYYQDSTLLHCAVENGHIEILEYLVTMGADIRAQDDLAVRKASMKGHLKIVKYLVTMGANINKKIIM